MTGDNANAHAAFKTVAVETMGVVFLAILAGFNEDLAGVLTVFMVGVLVIWLIAHGNGLAQIMQRIF